MKIRKNCNDLPVDEREDPAVSTSNGIVKKRKTRPRRNEIQNGIWRQGHMANEFDLRTKIKDSNQAEKLHNACQSNSQFQSRSQTRTHS